MSILPYENKICRSTYYRPGFSSVPSAAEYQLRLERYARDLDGYLALFKDELTYTDITTMPNKLLIALVDAKQKRLAAQQKAIQEEEERQRREMARNQILH